MIKICEIIVKYLFGVGNIVFANLYWNYNLKGVSIRKDYLSVTNILISWIFISASELNTRIHYKMSTTWMKTIYNFTTYIPNLVLLKTCKPKIRI